MSAFQLSQILVVRPTCIIAQRIHLGVARVCISLQNPLWLKAQEPAMHIYAIPLFDYLLLSDRIYLILLCTKRLSVIEGPIDSCLSK